MEDQQTPCVLGFPHTKSRLSTRSYGLPRIWWLPPNPLPCPPAKLQSPDHALELLLLLCWYHHQHATKMVWPLQGQEKRKPIQQEQFFLFFSGKRRNNEIPKKREEGNANQGLNQSHENGYPFNFASKRFIDN